MGEDDNPKRRDILKSVGGAGVGLTLFSGGASANPLGEGEVTLLEGTKRRRAARQFARTEAFQSLEERATENAGGDRVSFDESGVMVGRRRTEDMAREVVQFPLASVEDASHAAIVIGRHIDSRNVQFAWLDYYHETEDGILSEVRRIRYRSDDRAEGTGRSIQSTGADSVESQAEDVTPDRADISEETHSVDVDLVREVKRNVATTNTEVRGVDGRVSRQAVPNDLCDWCNYAVGTVCTTMCGAAGGFACGFFGITVPIAGVSCLTFVTVVCEVADRYSGCGAAVADEVCDDRFNVC